MCTSRSWIQVVQVTPCPNPAWKICRNVTVGDEWGGPRVSATLDHIGESGQRDVAHVFAATGWTFVTFTDFDNPTVITNLGPNCTQP